MFVSAHIHTHTRISLCPCLYALVTVIGYNACAHNNIAHVHDVTVAHIYKSYLLYYTAYFMCTHVYDCVYMLHGCYIQ